MAIPLIIASGVMQAGSQISAGYQASSASRYNAMVAEAKGKALQTSADFETQALEKQSAFETARILGEKAAFVSEQRAGFAKGGVRVDVGTPLEVMAETAAEFELDLAANRYNLALTKERIRYDTEVGVAQSKSEAAQHRLLAKSQKRAGFYQAGTTLLSTGASAYSLKGTPAPTTTSSRLTNVNTLRRGL